MLSKTGNRLKISKVRQGVRGKSKPGWTIKVRVWRSKVKEGVEGHRLGKVEPG